jgi:hypothetical protein
VACGLGGRQELSASFHPPPLLGSRSLAKLGVQACETFLYLRDTLILILAGTVHIELGYLENKPLFVQKVVLCHYMRKIIGHSFPYNKTLARKLSSCFPYVYVMIAWF